MQQKILFWKLNSAISSDGRIGVQYLEENLTFFINKSLFESPCKINETNIDMSSLLILPDILNFQAIVDLLSSK